MSAFQEALNDAGMKVRHALGVDSELMPILESLDRITVAHDARVAELLQSNNEMLERARVAEQRQRDTEAALLAAARVGSELGRMLVERNGR